MISFCGILLIVAAYLVVPGIGGIFLQGQFLAFSWESAEYIVTEKLVGMKVQILANNYPSKLHVEPHEVHVQQSEYSKFETGSDVT